MTTLTHEKQRELGLKLAKKFKARKTAHAIAYGNCYDAIFRTAHEEIGEKSFVQACVEAQEAHWVHLILCKLKLSDPARSALLRMLRAHGDTDDVLDTLECKSLTERERLKLECHFFAQCDNIHLAHSALDCNLIKTSSVAAKCAKFIVSESVWIAYDLLADITVKLPPRARAILEHAVVESEEINTTEKKGLFSHTNPVWKKTRIALLERQLN